MKIDDITVTLFAWDDIPPTQYGRQTGKFSGRSDLGLVTIKTDPGLEGHAFLGGSNRRGECRRDVIVRVFKPILLGQDPLDRELLFQRMWQRGRLFAIPLHRCDRRGALGYRGQGRRGCRCIS